MEDISLSLNEQRASRIIRQEDQNQEEPKPSIAILREARPSENIAIEKENKNEEETRRENETTREESPADIESTRIETVFKKITISSDNTDSSTDAGGFDQEKRTENDNRTTTRDNVRNSRITQEKELADAAQTETNVPASDLAARKKQSSSINETPSVGEISNKQQIYSINGSPSGRINKRRDISSSVFPVGCMGCKEEPQEDSASPRRFLNAKEASNNLIGHIDSIPRKKPSNTKSETNRNPVTGVGITNNDNRRQSFKRKDGNPLLGEGYENPVQTNNSGRVPPGGYSKGLW